MIDDPSLAYMHLTRSVEEPKMLILDHQTEKPDTLRFTEVVGGFLKADKNLVTKFAKSKACFLESCCNGLLCFTKIYDDRVLVLFNPLRQEVIALPPHTASLIPGKRKYGLGFDSSTNTYKVVRVFIRGGCHGNLSFNLGAEVYTLGTSSWRPISKGPPCRLAGRPIFACGALHWDALKGKYIVSFDVGKEEFGSISPPKYYSSSHLLDLGGNLAMVDRSFDSHIEIWVMKEYKKREWVKEYKIDINPPLGILDDSWVEVIGLWEFGEILLRYRESFISYNLKTGVKRYIEILGHDVEVLYHMGSLLSISKFQIG